MFGIMNAMCSILVQFVEHDYNYFWHKNEFCSVSSIVVCLYKELCGIFQTVIVVFHDVDAMFYLAAVALVLF